jgi:hypothetical protein
MRELRIQNVHLGKSHTYSDAFRIAFDQKTLEVAHQGPVVVTDWKESSGGAQERRLRIKSPIPLGFPDLLRKFLGDKNEICASVKQVATMVHDNKCTIVNRTRFVNIVGSKLLRLGSSFELSRTDAEDVTLSAHVRVRALLPPPFKAIAEDLVIETSRRNLDAYCKAISSAFSLASSS